MSTLKGYEPARKIAGMTPWACEYTDPKGRAVAIVLYGTDPAQIEEDHAAQYPDLRVVGELLATIGE